MHNKAIESRSTQKITLFDLLETVVSPPRATAYAPNINTLKC